MLTFANASIWYNILRKERKVMAYSYTYWPAAEGGYIGYWSDYPDFLTEGETIGELQQMLRSLRGDIDAMIADGTLTASSRQIGIMEFA